MFAVAMVVLYFVAPMALPDVELPVGLMGVLVGAIGIFFWWLFFSRAPWVERIGAILLMIVAVFVTRRLVHPSISGAGQGMLMYILPVPVLMLALVIWAAATRHLSTGARRVALAVAIALACVPFLIIRTDGVSTLVSQFHWRWTPTAEEILLAQAQDEPKPLPPTPAPAPAETPKEVPATKAEEKPATKVRKHPHLCTRAPAAPMAPMAPASRGVARISRSCSR